MKRLLWPLAVVIVPACLGVAGLLVAHGAPHLPAAPPDNVAAISPTPTAPSSPAAPSSPTPTISATASATPGPTVTPRRATRPRRHHTGPWAVVSTYYRDINSHRYHKAWALISPALAANQTYQQFVAGYTCTGSEQPTKLDHSGHQVSFNLVVANNCTGAGQYYTGTDTIYGGKIVAAHVVGNG